MFESICIKSNLSNNQKIDFSLLINAMLFYNDVNLFVHESELTLLLEKFGVELLAELINIGRIKLHIRQNTFGIASQFDENKSLYGVGCFSKNDDSVHGVLYRAHRKIVNNSSKNNKFADRFSYIVYSHSFPNEEVVKEIMDDFQSSEYLNEAVKEYLKFNYPSYCLQYPLEFNVERITNNDFPWESVRVHSNLDFAKLTDLDKEKGYNSPFNYGGLLLTLGESRCDNYLSANFSSDLITDQRFSKIISLQLKNSIRQTDYDLQQIELFNNHVLCDCPQLGDAFFEKVISTRQFIEILEKGDKWRTWLNSQPNNADLIGAYISEVTKETMADNKLIKIGRFILSCFMQNPVVASIYNVFDSLYIDKLLTGWKPNHYIQDELVSRLKA